MVYMAASWVASFTYSLDPARTYPWDPPL